MKNPENREELEALPIALFGFIFYPPSPRNVSGMTEEELLLLTDTSKEKVAVFVNEQPEAVTGQAGKYGFTHVQLHGNETPESCGQIRKAGFKVIKVFHIHPGFSFEITRAYAGAADYFLFEKGSEGWGGSGKKWDWSLLNSYHLETPFFLSGGIGQNDAEAIAALHHPAFYGIDLNSGFEDSPGFKNREKLREFLDQLRIIRIKG